jgi:hypothetical protein
MNLPIALTSVTMSWTTHSHVVQVWMCQRHREQSLLLLQTSGLLRASRRGRPLPKSVAAH